MVELFINDVLVVVLGAQNNMNYKTWFNTSKYIDAMVEEATIELKAILPNDLNGQPLSDEIRISEEYITRKKKFNIAFKRMQDFNAKSPKEFKKRRSEEYRANKLNQNKA